MQMYVFTALPICRACGFLGPVLREERLSLSLRLLVSLYHSSNPPLPSPSHFQRRSRDSCLPSTPALLHIYMSASPSERICSCSAAMKAFWCAQGVAALSVAGASVTLLPTHAHTHTRTSASARTQANAHARIHTDTHTRQFPGAQEDGILRTRG